MLALVLIGGGRAAAQEGEERAPPPGLLEDLQRIDTYYRTVRGRLDGSGGQPAEDGADTDAVDPASESPPFAAPAPGAAPAPTGAPPAPERAAAVARTRGGRRNPFAATGRILTELRAGSAAARYEFRTLDGPLALPRMSLKGLLHHAGGEIAALLEIERLGVFIVREGDTVGLHELDPEAVIRVREINRLNLVVEAGSLGHILIVR